MRTCEQLGYKAIASELLRVSNRYDGETTHLPLTNILHSLLQPPYNIPAIDRAKVWDSLGLCFGADLSCDFRMMMKSFTASWWRHSYSASCKLASYPGAWKMHADLVLRLQAWEWWESGSTRLAWECILCSATSIRETLGRKLNFASYLSACFAVYGIPDPSGWYN